MNTKLLSVIIPCYNSADYMRKAVHSVLAGGDDVEIIIVDDGSADQTGSIADQYQKNYPEICIAIHKENGGHGDAVMTGLKRATGIYVDVLDSDDWMDKAAFPKMLSELRQLSAPDRQTDLFVRNTIYDKNLPNEKHKHTIHFRGSIPSGRRVTWDECGRFPTGSLIFMHSAVFRREFLLSSGLSMPKHTFYVDHLYVYIPMRYVKTIYYADLNVYHYRIGREGQSVQADIMIKQIDQALKVFLMMAKAFNVEEIECKKQRLYIRNYLEMMVSTSYAFLTIDGKPASLRKRDKMMSTLAKKQPWVYKTMLRRPSGIISSMPDFINIPLVHIVYYIFYKVFRFN